MTGPGEAFTRAKLLALASEGRLVATLTARLGGNVDVENPQPALWTRGPIERQRGHQRFPTLRAGETSMTLSGRHIRDDARLFVDGRRASGTVRTGDNETLTIALASLPPAGMHFLQVQNPDGLISNDFIFLVSDERPHQR